MVKIVAYCIQTTKINVENLSKIVTEILSTFPSTLTFPVETKFFVRVICLYPFQAALTACFIDSSICTV